MIFHISLQMLLDNKMNSSYCQSNCYNYKDLSHGQLKNEYLLNRSTRVQGWLLDSLECGNSCGFPCRWKHVFCETISCQKCIRNFFKPRSRPPSPSSQSSISLTLARDVLVQVLCE